MAETKDYYDLLQAYCLGCLDKEDLSDLKDFLASCSDSVLDDLGKYQKLTALLPSILDIEMPDHKLKDKVARKLYRFKSIKSSQTEQAKNNITTQLPTELKEQSSEQTGDKSSVENSGGSEHLEAQPIFEEVKPKSSSKKFEVINSLLHEENISPVKTHEHSINENKTEEEEIVAYGNNKLREKGEPIKEKPLNNSLYEKKSSKVKNVETKYGINGRKSRRGGLIFFTSLFFIIAVGMSVLYFNVSSEVKEYKSGIENLSDQIRSLNSKLIENRDFKEIIGSKNAAIINLRGTELYPGGFGKVILNNKIYRGFLQLANLPILPETEAYQLWAKNKDKYTSLGLFSLNNDTGYFIFSLPGDSGIVDSEYIISQEPSTGSIAPGKQILLTGSLK